MKRGFRTKREAEQYLAVVEVSKMRGEWLDPTRSHANVLALSAEWYSAQVQIKPTTRSGYRFALDKHVLPRWGNIRLVDVTHGEIQAWVNSLSTSLGPSIVRQIYLVLAGVLKFAVRDGRLLKSPADDVQLPRLIKKSRGYLTHVQLRTLANECAPWSDLFSFLGYTGLRWGEMAAITAASVNGPRGRVDVHQAISEPRGMVIWGTPESHERRSDPFPAFLRPELEQRMTGGQIESTFMAPMEAFSEPVTSETEFSMRPSADAWQPTKASHG